VRQENILRSLTHTSNHECKWKQKGTNFAIVLRLITTDIQREEFLVLMKTHHLSINNLYPILLKVEILMAQQLGNCSINKCHTLQNIATKLLVTLFFTTCFGLYGPPEDKSNKSNLVAIAGIF
jgi:hypothetical protein